MIRNLERPSEWQRFDDYLDQAVAAAKEVRRSGRMGHL